MLTRAHGCALNNAVYHRTAGKDSEALEMYMSVEFDRHKPCIVDPDDKKCI